MQVQTLLGFFLKFFQIVACYVANWPETLHLSASASWMLDDRCTPSHSLGFYCCVLFD